MENIEINYKGDDLYVTGNYYKGEDRTFDYPGSPSEFEILSVLDENDKEIMEDINLDDLEAEILEDY